NSSTVGIGAPICLESYQNSLVSCNNDLFNSNLIRVNGSGFNRSTTIISQDSDNQLPSIRRNVRASAIDEDGNKIFLVNSVGNLLEIDLNSGFRTQINLGEAPTGASIGTSGLAFEPEKKVLYWAGGMTGFQSILIIDPQSGHSVVLSGRSL
ncbi:MAG TPA: hypothetical protein VIC08_01440, partial [Cellvibrionaceae bacterium]